MAILPFPVGSRMVARYRVQQFLYTWCSGVYLAYKKIRYFGHYWHIDLPLPSSLEFHDSLAILMRSLKSLIKKPPVPVYHMLPHGVLLSCLCMRTYLMWYATILIETNHAQVAHLIKEFRSHQTNVDVQRIFSGKAESLGAATSSSRSIRWTNRRIWIKLIYRSCAFIWLMSRSVTQVFAVTVLHIYIVSSHPLSRYSRYEVVLAFVTRC